MPGVCQQGGEVAGGTVNKGRVEGDEVREHSSGWITCCPVGFEEESGFVWSVLNICQN